MHYTQLILLQNFPESDIMVKTIFRPQETVSLEHGEFFCFVLILKEI